VVRRQVERFVGVYPVPGAPLAVLGDVSLDGSASTLRLLVGGVAWAAGPAVPPSPFEKCPAVEARLTGPGHFSEGGRWRRVSPKMRWCEGFGGGPGTDPPLKIWVQLWTLQF